MKTKKLASLFLASAMILSLSACGKDAGADVSGAGETKADVHMDVNGVAYLADGVKDNDPGVNFLTPDNLSVYGLSEDESIVYTTEYVTAVKNGMDAREQCDVTKEDYQKTVDEVAPVVESIVKNNNISFTYNDKEMTYPLDLSVFLDDGWYNYNYSADASNFAERAFLLNDKYSANMTVSSYTNVHRDEDMDLSSGYSGLTETLLDDGIYCLRFDNTSVDTSIPFKFNGISLFESNAIYQILKDVDVASLSYSTFSKPFNSYDIYNDDSVKIDTHPDVSDTSELDGLKNSIVNYQLVSKYDDDGTPLDLLQFSFSINDNGQVFDFSVEYFYE